VEEKEKIEFLDHNGGAMIMDELIKALKVQTLAINALADSISMLAALMVDDEGDQGSPKTYLNGKPL